MSQPNLAKIYSAVPVFRTLTEEELEEVLSISKLYRVGKGYVVVRQGDAGDGMYVIVQGSAQVQLQLFQGDRTSLAVLKSGDVFGELSLIDRIPRSATVVMQEDGVLYRVDADGFDALRQKLRPAAFKIIREVAPILCQRMREINRRVGEIFENPERSMAILEKRYLAGVHHARPVDRKGAGGTR